MTGLLAHIHQKEKIALEIAVKVASVNGPSEQVPLTQEPEFDSRSGHMHDILMILIDTYECLRLLRFPSNNLKIIFSVS